MTETQTQMMRNIDIGLHAARYSVQAIFNTPMAELSLYPFLERELIGLQEDVWQAVQKLEKWKAEQKRLGVIEQI